jgi:hypothetical protein
VEKAIKLCPHFLAPLFQQLMSVYSKIAQHPIDLGKVLLGTRFGQMYWVGRNASTLDFNTTNPLVCLHNNQRSMPTQQSTCFAVPDDDTVDSGRFLNLLLNVQFKVIAGIYCLDLERNYLPQFQLCF